MIKKSLRAYITCCLMKTQPIYAVFDRKDRLSDSERVFPDSFYLRVHTDALAPALQVTRPLVDTKKQ